MAYQPAREIAPPKFLNHPGTWISFSDLSLPSDHDDAMDINDMQTWLVQLTHELSDLLHKLPGSAIVLRYVKSSYQDDPIRSGIELFLVLFVLRYLLAPSYSTQKTNNVELTEKVRCNRAMQFKQT